MRDRSIALDIAKAIPTDRTVLEIGPGDGFFTEILLETDHQVIAIEIDTQWMEKLKSRLRRFKDFKLIAGNILKIDWTEFSERNPDINITGNLPFHIASTTLFAILKLVREGGPPRVHEMTVMMQKEVAQRLTAENNTKAFGSITLLTRYHGTTEYVLTVPSRSFFPKPKVDGAIIKLRFHRHEDLPEIDYSSFRRVVKGCFTQRRKMMRNCIGVVNDLPEGWQDLDYDFQKRPEQFSFEEFVSLTNDLVALGLKK